MAANIGAVKQEIAKEGILPYSLFFARSYDLSLGRLFGRKPPKEDVNSLYSENTPAATLALHWTFTNLMAIIPALTIRPQPYIPTPAYTFVVGVVVYVTNLIKFTLIAIGLLCLRFSPKVRWAEKSQFKHPVVSVTAALILLTICVFPLILIWVPDRAYTKLTNTSNLVSWFAIQTFGLCIVGFAFLYWVLFRCYIAIRSAREGKTLHVKREPKFKVDSGGLTQIVEIVTLQWVREVGMGLDEIEKSETNYSRQVFTPTKPHELPGKHSVSELDVNQSYVRNRGPEHARHELA